jgi:hypothetical protein
MLHVSQITTPLSQFPNKIPHRLSLNGLLRHGISNKAGVSAERVKATRFCLPLETLGERAVLFVVLLSALAAIRHVGKHSPERPVSLLHNPPLLRVLSHYWGRCLCLWEGNDCIAVAV